MYIYIAACKVIRALATNAGGVYYWQLDGQGNRYASEIGWNRGGFLTGTAEGRCQTLKALPPATAFLDNKIRVSKTQGSQDRYKGGDWIFICKAEHE